MYYDETPEKKKWQCVEVEVLAGVAQWKQHMQM